MLILPNPQNVEQMRAMSSLPFAQGQLQEVLADSYPIFEQDSLIYEHRLIMSLINQAIDYQLTSYQTDFTKVSAGNEIMTATRAQQLKIIMAVFIRILWYKANDVNGRTGWLHELVKQLMRKKLPYTSQDLVWIASHVSDIYNHFMHFPFKSFNKYALATIKESGNQPQIKQAFTSLKNSQLLANIYHNAETDKIMKGLQAIIDYGDSNLTTAPIWLNENNDAFGSFINEKIKSLTNEQKGYWFLLLKHVEKSSSSKPSKKFEKELNALLDSVGKTHFQEVINHGFTQLYKKGTFSIENWRDWDQVHINKNYIKGLVWASQHVLNESLIRVLAQLTERCFQTIPEQGPLSSAVGNAVIYVLGNAKSLDAIAQLSRLKLKIRQNNTRKLINKYISDAANSLGLSTGQIEDHAMPDFGLVNGILEKHFDDFTAIVTIESIGKTSLAWKKTDGKTQKSVPSIIKSNFSSELKQLKATIKEIQKTLTAQRDRLDRSYIENRTWNWADFNKFYLNHGLMGFISKQLIWQFDFSDRLYTAIFQNDTFVAHNGQALDLDWEKANVRLWHPIYAEVEEVLAWRNYLEEKEIQQPLKQAFREVYLVTDAELNTNIYSNRFAAHILKQHQFNTLAKLRGWQYSLMGAYDDGIENQICQIKLPSYSLNAEFWIDEMNANDAFNDTGIWLYVITDQVRFKQHGETVPVDEIPALPFSEIMRDVDLFVGVASIGNDPNWEDHGNDRRRFNYWQSYSFGELSESAKTRKKALERLIPRLKIANQCSFDQKFLVVKGEWRTYKIHMGSGNILMAPNDEYLCIVPDRKPKSPNQVFLPFEGDNILSIILSKAMMLAEDTKINDESILRQIHR